MKNESEAMQQQGEKKRGDGFTPLPNKRNLMGPPSTAADRTTPTLSSVPEAKTLVPVGELKRNSLRDSLRRIHDRASSILLFSLQWKDLEDHYADADASLKRRVDELEALEGSVVRQLKEAGRWARMLGDRAEAKIRVLEDKVGGLVTKERVFSQEIKERLRTVDEAERMVAREGAAVCEEMRRRGQELDGLIERVRVEEEMIRRKQMDLGFREKFVEDVEKELEEGKREVVSKERELNEALKRIISREKEIEEKEKEREVKGREIEEKMAKIVSMEKVVGERAKCAELKGAEFVGKLRELSLTRKELDAKLDKVGLMEVELVTKGWEMELRDKEFEKKLKVVELKEKMFEDWLEEIESKKKDINERLKEVCLKENSLAECSKETDLRTQEANKNYEMKMEELKLREKRLEDRAKQIELKEREVNRITVEADLKKKTIENPRKVIEEPRKVCGPSRERSTLFPHDTKDEPAKKITLAKGGTAMNGVLSSNGKALQIFLIENWESDTSFRHNVFEIIKASPNPARLVLDALLAFYPSRDKRDNSEGKCTIFRKENCLLLLEELRNISPEIGRTEKDEALKLSIIWYHSMKGDIEIVNFFNLLAAYKLASSYFVDDLLKKVGRVRYSRKMLELCRVLGLTDEIPGLVQDLVNFNNNLPSAIRFINAFELNDSFPVEAIINKCIRNSADAANAGPHNQRNSIKTQKKVRKRRLAEMNALMECIEDCRIRSKHTERIREIIFSLGGHNPNSEGGANRAGKICASTKLGASCRATTPLSVNPVPDTTAEVPPSCQLNKQPKTAAPAEAGQIILDDTNPIHHLSEQQARLGQGETFESKKSRSNELSGKVDGKSLKIIFGGEVDFDKAHEKAYKLLHASPDPARLVLGALMGNISSNTRGKEDFKLGMPLKVCIQLLKLLKRFSPMISHQLHEDAKEFAMTWKSNLKARSDDYVAIVCFLLFLSAFKLSSAFDAGQIVGLLDPASWRKHVLHTCAILGLKDAIPDFIQGLVEMKNWLYAMKYAHTFGMEDKFPLEPLLKDYMAYWENKADDLCKAHPGSPLVQMNAIEKMLTATRVTIKCVMFYKLGSRCSMKDLQARMQQLEKQKADIAMKLKDFNIEHSDGSNSSASEQETVEEPAVTDNSPSACSNEDALISANVPTSAKAAVVDTSFSASSKDNAQVSADTSTIVKTSAPGISPSASSNVNAQVLPDTGTCSKDAESGSAMTTGGKRSCTSATLDHQANPPQAKRQAQVPCWRQNAPPPYINSTWRNCGPPLPQYPPVHHPYHPYQLRPPHMPGMIHEVPLQNGWRAPYPDPRNPYDGPPPHW